MDTLVKNMDFPVTHWAPFPRKFPAALPVSSAAFIRKKDHWIRHSFSTCNFSLILRGRGEFRLKHQVWPVEAPCVLTQWPGEFVEYGPPLPKESWDEFYVIYGGSLLATLKKSRLIDTRRPVWPIHDPAAVMKQIEELRTLSQSPHPETMADRFDRVCERLLLETLAAPPESSDPIQKIVRELTRDPAADFDLQATAHRNGLSESSFRRRWAEAIPSPPHRYQLQLRLQKACRLLAETRQPVYEIAHLCGFEDELYFSRRFRLQMKMSPREYRRIYHTGRRS